MLPFGNYTLDCVQKSCAQLEEMSADAVLKVRTLLDEYEAAKTAEKTANLADTEGKTLVKADVLEWEKGASGTMSGPQEEMARSRAEIGNYFAFSPCMGNFGGSNAYTTSLIRS